MGHRRYKHSLWDEDIFFRAKEEKERNVFGLGGKSSTGITESTQGGSQQPQVWHGGGKGSKRGGGSRRTYPENITAGSVVMAS